MRTTSLFFSLIVLTYIVISCEPQEELSKNKYDDYQWKKEKMIELAKEYGVEDALVLPDDTAYIRALSIDEFEEKAREHAKVTGEIGEMWNEKFKDQPSDSIFFEFLDKIKAAKSQAEADSIIKAYEGQIEINWGNGPEDGKN